MQTIVQCIAAHARARLNEVRSFMRDNVATLAVLAGAALFFSGLWDIYPPLAKIAAGAMSIAAGILAAGLFGAVHRNTSTPEVE